MVRFVVVYILVFASYFAVQLLAEPTTTDVRLEAIARSEPWRGTEGYHHVAGPLVGGHVATAFGRVDVSRCVALAELPGECPRHAIAFGLVERTADGWRVLGRWEVAPWLAIGGHDVRAAAGREARLREGRRSERAAIALAGGAAVIAAVAVI